MHENMSSIIIIIIIIIITTTTTTTIIIYTQKLKTQKDITRVLKMKRIRKFCSLTKTKEKYKM